MKIREKTIKHKRRTRKEKREHIENIVETTLVIFVITITIIVATSLIAKINS